MPANLTDGVGTARVGRDAGVDAGAVAADLLVAALGVGLTARVGRRS